MNIEHLLSFISNNTVNIIGSIFSGIIGSSIIIYKLLENLISSKITKDIQYRYDLKLEEYKSELDKSINKEIELYKSQIRVLDEQNLSKWEIKRNACLKALDMADAAMTNMDWGEIGEGIVKGSVDTIEIRKCYNELACSCDYPETLSEFKNVLGLSGRIGADAIVDFRNAIRKELGFGQDIDTDREASLIKRIVGDETK